MVQGYYTLQQAAEYLDMPVDELKQMAQKGQIRSFQDRGNLRFRIQDIQELARARGLSSDPDLVLGEAPSPKPAAPPSSTAKKAPPASGAKKGPASPKPLPASGAAKKTSMAPAGPKTPSKQEAKGAPDVFDFALDDSEDVDLAIPKSGAKSKAKKPVSPVPQAGSDSDVRLVADGSDVTFSIPKDSDIKLVESDPKAPKSGALPPSSTKRSQSALDSGPKSKSKLAGPATPAKPVSPKPASGPQPVDSGVRLVPLDDDSDVKLHGSSSDELPLGEGGTPTGGDSNVRLEKVQLPPADSGEGSAMLTEEINLDEEILKQQEREKNQPATKLKAKSELKLPKNSPFELSDSDLEMPPELKKDAGPKTPTKTEGSTPADSSDFELAAQKPEDGSSEFDLTPASDDDTGTALLEGDSSADFSLEAGGDDVLEEEKTELTGATSGISLDNPVDAGISLEDEESGDFDLSLGVEDTPRPSKSRPVGDDSSDFEMSSAKTPRPTASSPVEDSEGEFDLTLDSDSDAPLLEEQQDDSAFELNLEGSGDDNLSGELDPGSEFELTLDDSGNLQSLDDDAAPQVKTKKGKKAPKSGDEQDIFETDFEVPSLDESDDAAVADSELESSDFDLALDDSELAQDEESGSEVVALDEEEPETVVDDSGVVSEDVQVEEESSDFADLDQDVVVEDDEEGVEVEEEGAEGKTKGKTVIKDRLVEPAPWGVMPVIFMLPCVIIMFLVAILSFEMVQTSTGMRPPGPLTSSIASGLGMELKAK